ncbi:AMP-binding protein [Halioxenophilus sp. WMMB6]|uniref:AMP-binding protein n=1 Tax=Halioxenophilus sp. WMMB6 TaxID=3073815 RepID=UPI00295E4A81|nr:AMP-binding protein [Halioxenophilus sp. WMMB6]
MNSKTEPQRLNPAGAAHSTPTTPLHTFLHWEQEQANVVWLTQPQADGTVVTYTWAEAGIMARKIAAYIQSLQLPEQSNIVLIGQNAAEWIIADLAIWMSGHVSVPIYPTINGKSFSYIVQHSAAKLLIIGRMDENSASFQEVAEAIASDTAIFCLPDAPHIKPLQGAIQWQQIQTDYQPIADIHLRDREALATIVYTSGTTGEPKGVMHCFRSICAPCEFPEVYLPSSSDDRVLSYLPLAHIGERVAVEIPSLYFGFQIYFNYSLATFPADLKRARPTSFFSVPRLWTKFYQAVNAKLPPWKQRILFALPFISKRIKKKILEGMGLDHARLGMTAAAPLAAEIVSWYRSLGLELIELFGMTENAATSHGTRVGQITPGFVGFPHPGVECRLDDSGEILVKSPGQMLGYYRQPEMTAACLTDDGFFRTGDKGVIDGKTKQLKITGRVKDLFKTAKGKFVAPVPIENELGAHQGIETVCVTGRGHPQPFALVTLSPEVQHSSEAERTAIESDLAMLLEHTNAHLEDHEQLSFIAIGSTPWTVELGLVTPTLKVKRDCIDEYYEPKIGQWFAAKKPVVWE